MLSHAAVSLAALASLACSFLIRAIGPTATPQPPPTSTPSPLSASEELQCAVPSSTASLDIRTLALSSDDLDSSDPAVASFLTGLNPSEVEIAASIATGEDGVVFQAGAIRIPGRYWSAALDALAASTGGTFPVTWDRITLSGYEVLRGQEIRDALVPPIYYLASGDTLLSS